MPADRLLTGTAHGPAEVVVAPDVLQNLVVSALAARGAPVVFADIQASHLVEAEMRGHPSHGLRRTSTLVARIESGLLDPAAEPRMEWRAAGALRVDGARGLGPVAAFRAIDLLSERVPQTGIAAASLHRTHHLGMLAPYVERLADRGLVGLVLSSTEGLVHPWGGSGALLGTNPLGVAVPARGGDLVLDMSTGAVSAGKILDYRARGLPLPDGWAIDAHGHPTTDAAAAAVGAISPFGGAKGYALGVALGAIVGALTATALGPEVHGTLDASFETSKGDVIIAIDPRVFAGADTRGSLGAYFDLIRGSGVDGAAVGVPGDRAREARRIAERDGLHVARDVWDVLNDLAQDRGEGEE
jgi:L-2-hydroxycarboxylate dehydrogenase (NAD+)